MILKERGDFVKFTQSNPFYYIKEITGIVEVLDGDSSGLKKEFRISTTKNYKENWNLLTLDSIRSMIPIDSDIPIFVDFKYTLETGGPVDIRSVELSLEFSEKLINWQISYVPPQVTSGNIFNFLGTDYSNLLNLYSQQTIQRNLQFLTQITYGINSIFGHDVLYARANPLLNGRDIVLKEWTLYDVDNPCPFRIIVPENEFPDSKHNFNPYGIDFETPFEIHIVKKFWEQTFGADTSPQKRDIVYFPLTNRIYEVESSYLFKEILQQGIYYKVNLKKYAPKSNRFEPTDLRQQLDNVSWDSEELLVPERKEQEIELTKPQQYDHKIASRNFDPVRAYFNPKLRVAQEILRNYNLTLSESRYLLNSIPKTEIAVRYKIKNEYENFSLAAWVRQISQTSVVPKDSVFGNPEISEDLVTIYLKKKRRFGVGDILKVTKGNGFSIYGTFVGSEEIFGGITKITIRVNSQVLEFVNQSYPNWQTQTGYFVEQNARNLIFSGGTWELNLVADRFFVFSTQFSESVFCLNNPLGNSWFSFFLNVSGTTGTLNIYERKWSEETPDKLRTTDLTRIFGGSREFVGPLSSSESEYFLGYSNLEVTNIRLFKELEVSEDSQVLILNQAIVEDSQNVIIVDNALPLMDLPYIGNSK